MCAWMIPFAIGVLMLAEMSTVERRSVCQKGSKMARHQLLERGKEGKVGIALLTLGAIMGREDSME